MEISSHQQLSQNLTSKASNKPGKGDASFQNITDSFNSTGKTPDELPDLKKAAQMLLKKGYRGVRDEWSLEIAGSPAVVSKKSLVIGGFDAPVKSLDPRSGEELWSSDRKGYVCEGKDGTLFVAGGGKTLSALDPGTGLEKWSMDFKFDVRVFDVGKDGTVFAKTSSTTYAIDPDKREMKWECKTLGFPVVTDDGKVFLSDGYDDIKRIDPKTGNEMWVYNNIGKCNCTPGVGKNGDVYAADYLGKVTAIDPETGKAKWEFKTDSSILNAPLVGPDGDLYINNNNQHIYAVDPETGKQKWRFEGDGFNYTHASFAPDGNILFTAGDNLYVLNPENGKKLWEKKMPGAITEPPVMGKDGRIHFPCWDRKIYSVKLPGFKDALKEGDVPEETTVPDTFEENREIKLGKGFVDIGGIKLKVNKSEEEQK